jgi:chromate transporter
LADKQRVPLLELFKVFFHIGLMSFGGGLVSWIHREVVDVRGWMTSEEFLSGMSLSQILPGVNSTNTSIFVGQRLRGAVGATVACGAMLAGPFFIILLAGMAYKTLLGTPGFPALVEGVGAVAMGLLTRLGIQAGRSVKIGLAPALATLATFIGVGVMRWPMLAVVAVVAPLSVAAAWPRGSNDA